MIRTLIIVALLAFYANRADVRAGPEFFGRHAGDAVPEFHISRIDVETGKTYINWDKVFKKDGDRSIICFHNTRGYWPTAYHPGTNSLYIPFADACLDMEAKADNAAGYGIRVGVRRPGSDPQKFAGLAKVNMTTGRSSGSTPHRACARQWRHADHRRRPAILGRSRRRLRAFDADTGKILWQTILGRVIQTSTVTYAVNGRQYVAVLTGDVQSATANLIREVPTLTTPRGHNAIYVFALPDRR